MAERQPVPVEALRFFTPQQQHELLSNPTPANLAIIRAEGEASLKANEAARAGARGLPPPEPAAAPQPAQPLAAPPIGGAPQPNVQAQPSDGTAEAAMLPGAQRPLIATPPAGLRPKLREAFDLLVSDDPFRQFINALILHESGGEQSAVSKKGAVGIMQLRGPGLRTPETTRDPVKNVLTGTAHFLSLVDKYDGDAKRAIYAWNWGEGRVDRAIKQHGDAWEQRAPSETRRLFQRVAASLRSGRVPDFVSRVLRATPATAQPGVAQ